MTLNLEKVSYVEEVTVIGPIAGINHEFKHILISTQYVKFLIKLFS